MNGATLRSLPVSNPAPAGNLLRDGAFAVLRQASAGQFNLAQAALAQLFDLRGRFTAYALLADIASGRQPCQRSGDLFVLGTAPLSLAMRRNFDDAVNQCQRFLGLPAPCIVVECRAEARDLHLTHECFPGLALVRLSSLSPGFPDDLRAVQFHEVAHCFLTCGVRLLDEGLAQLFAKRHADVPLLAGDPALLPSVRSMLSRQSDAMFGERIEVYHAACRFGADLVDAIYSLGGATGLVTLFQDIARAATDAQIVALVEAASGQRFAPIPAPANGAHMQLAVRTREAVFAAWVDKNPALLDSAIDALSAHNVYAEPALLDALLNGQLNRALLQVNFATRPTPEQVAAIDALLRAADCLPPGRLWLWRGTRAILAILLARPNIIKVAGAGQQALVAFNKAAELIPDDPDLLVQHASLLLNAPADYGGDRDLGVAKLRQAMQDPAYHEHARQVLLEYGIDDTPAPATGPLPLQDKQVPLVDVRGLHLAFATGFQLAPGDFTLHEGERVALVGPNGSGKSMLLEALLGLRTAAPGAITWHLPQTTDARQQMGGLLQGADFPAQIKVSEIMALHRKIYHRTDAEVTRALGLAELAARYWQQLSRGQKQRVMLWLALSHLPAVALLDEPSLGLDEWHARALRDLLARLPMALLVVSHVPADLQGMDRIVCLGAGAITAQGSLTELMTQQVGQFKARVHQALAPDALAALHALPCLARPPIERDGGWDLFGSDGFDQPFRRFIDHHRVPAFSLEAVSVEDFLAHVTHE